MVNKKMAGSGLVRSLLFILTFFSFTLPAQNLSKHYRSSFQNGSILYFIYELKGFHSLENNDPLRFDITYLSNRDSATLNFSYFDKRIRSIDSVAFNNGAAQQAMPVKKLFVETKKRKWHYRYTAQIPYPALKSLFAPGAFPVLVLYSKEGTIHEKMTRKRLRKVSAMLSKLFVLIDYNQAR